MAEYIEREALLQQLEMAIECKDCPRNVDRKTYYDKCAYSEIQDICDAITEAPKADVQPVRHGRWIEVSPKHSKCSCCETTCLIAQYPISANANFCPNCGADMSTKG